MAQSLKYLPLLSLEEIALRRLAAVLWNRSDVLASVMKVRCHESIMDRMKDKIMKLELPETLTKRMVDVVTSISLEIRSWGDFHEVFSFSCIEIFEQDSAKLIFTTAGTVDDRRMAQEVIRCDEIDFVQRYEMACSYWLEDSIPILWQEVTEEDKECFSKKNNIFEGLQFSWPHFFKDGQSNLDSNLRKSDRNVTSLNQWTFEHSVKKGFKATTEYFFRRLSHEERGASLMRSAYAACSAVRMPDLQRQLLNVLLYLLSLMTPEQQTEIIKAHPVIVMSCFFEWSRRELFSENAGLIWPFLSPSHYYDLLHTFFSYDPIRHPEFFKESPLDFKKYIVGSFPFSVLFLHVFFKSEDCECIELFFRSVDVEDRLELVFDDIIFRFFYDSMARGKWRLVEVYL